MGGISGAEGLESLRQSTRGVVNGKLLDEARGQRLQSDAGTKLAAVAAALQTFTRGFNT